METAFAVTHYVKYAVGKGRSTWLENVFEFQSSVTNFKTLTLWRQMLPIGNA